MMFIKPSAIFNGLLYPRLLLPQWVKMDLFGIVTVNNDGYSCRAPTLQLYLNETLAQAISYEFCLGHS